MFNWIKKRQYKIKNRLYIEAKYLDKADFCIGQSIKYTIDKKKRKVTISTVSYENNSTKKVAKTTNRTGVTPVIDIKTKDIKEFINSNENIELTIYKGKIILRAKQIVKVKSGSKVVELKTKQLTVCSKKFAKVVNANQISIFDLFNLDSNEEDMSSEEFKNATKPKAIKMISLFSGAGMLDNGDSLIAHPQLDRKLSVAEGLSLFSFTNFDLEKNSSLNTVENISQNENISLKGNMKLYGSITSMYEQLKNGVDYKVSSFLAKTILEQF